MTTDQEIRASMTSEQIQLERKLTCEAIDGAIAFGHQGTNPPPSDDHWLAPFWNIGAKLREAEAAILQAATRDSSLDSGECFIVKGSGETDLPIVHIVRDLEAARHAVLSLMYSDPKEADPDEDEDLFADLDDAMADSNYWSVEFEIGGISVERVCLDATCDAPSADAVDAQRLNWLDQTNERFKMGWRVGIAPAGNVSIQRVIELGEDKTSIRAAIDKAIAASAPKETRK
jgi:hypothetical protein